MLVGNLALVVAALFTGAAFYVNFAEQTARLSLDDGAMLAEWKPSYKRGYAMQAPLALVGLVLGIAAWQMTARVAFLAGAIMMIANWPWTLIGVAPTNRALMTTGFERAGPESRRLIIKWGKLHGVRTLLGALSIVAFLVGLIQI